MQTKKRKRTPSHLSWWALPAWCVAPLLGLSWLTVNLWYSGWN